MSWHTWTLFMATEIVLCLIPGPAVLFVVSQGLRFGGRGSLWANAGILCANSFYFLLSAIGLGAVLAASHQLFLVIRYTGAAYLIYLGLATMFGRGLGLASAPTATDGANPGIRLLARGFVLQAANPKSLIFFTALLPQFIRPDQPVPLQILVLGLSSLVAEFSVLGLYGFSAGRAATLAQQPRFINATNRVAGGLLIGAGAGIALAGEQ
jgi:threonine/homoserine/homoserine lactone efflux protein